MIIYDNIYFVLVSEIRHHGVYVLWFTFLVFMVSENMKPVVRRGEKSKNTCGNPLQFKSPGHVRSWLCVTERTVSDDDNQPTNRRQTFAICFQPSTLLGQSSAKLASHGGLFASQVIEAL